jgi:hypothetical protein
MHYQVGKTQCDGIAMMHSGELLGGDLEHVRTGTYEEEGSKVSARIRIVPNMSSPDAEIMAREQPIILYLSGYCTEEFARLEGSPDEMRGLRFELTMRKCTGNPPADAEKLQLPKILETLGR